MELGYKVIFRADLVFCGEVRQEQGHVNPRNIAFFEVTFGCVTRTAPGMCVVLDEVLLFFLLSQTGHYPI